MDPAGVCISCAKPVKCTSENVRYKIFLGGVMRMKQDMEKNQRNMKDHRFTFIDLFAGIGGMRIAFENNGGDCVYSNEWNKYSQQTYFANFGEQPDDDITKVDARSIPNHDILVAGFPCQPFSIAGVSKKQSLGRATGFEDKTQGTLFFDVCRILKEKRPKAFMLENVKNLCSHDKGRTFKTDSEIPETGNEKYPGEGCGGQIYFVRQIVDLSSELCCKT